MTSADLKRRFQRYKQDALYPAQPTEPYIPPATQQEWRDKYRVRLAWSNSNVSNEVLLRKALDSNDWYIVLSAARLFGAQYMNDLYRDSLADTCDDESLLHRYRIRENNESHKNKKEAENHKNHEYLEMLLNRATHGRFEFEVKTVKTMENGENK
jgi:hypothetical protein